MLTSLSKGIQLFLRRFEDGLLVSLLCLMLGVALYQIVARNFFDGGLAWGDTLVRIVVFWVALVGAMVASRNDDHIRIDVVARFLGPRAKQRVARVTCLFTALLCMVFAWHSFQFVLLEYQDGTTAFASVPAWICEAIIPVVMAVMALRYLLHSLAPP